MNIKHYKSQKKLFNSLILFLLLLFVLPTKVYALDFDSRCVEIEWENEPEGTTYIDILVKMDCDDEDYVDFTAAPRRFLRRHEFEELPIDKNSEIAEINIDGYISLSLHYKYISDLTIWENENAPENIYKNQPPQLHFTINENNIDIISVHKKYGDFKAAYVDECSRVLGITKSSKIRYNSKEPYGFYAKGESLTFHKYVDLYSIILIIGILFILISFILIFKIILEIRWYKQKNTIK